MDTSNIERRLRYLTLYAVSSSVIILFMFISAFSPFVGTSGYKDASTPFQADTLHVRYLTAERVDLIEPDGNLAIALSNSVKGPFLTILSFAQYLLPLFFLEIYF